MHESHGLVQTLLAAELVDEFNVWTFPLLLGRGKHLFGEGTVPTTLRVASSQVTGTGAAVGSYEPTGPVVQKTATVEDGKVVV